MRWNAFASTDERDLALAGVVSDQVTAASSEWTLAIPGGKTPLGFCRALNTLVMNPERLRLLLTDERWVDLDDAASNEGHLRPALSELLGQGAQWISLRGVDQTLHDALARLSGELMAAWPLDHVVLGMGEDGHVASIFPAQNEASTNGWLMSGFAPDGVLRLGLGMQALDSAGHVSLLVNGMRKAQGLQAVADGLHAEWPIARLWRQRPDLSVYWAP